MTMQMKRSWMLIIILVMIGSWYTPIKASQDNQGQMTDGTYFIFNQVTSNCAIKSTGNGYTNSGSLGQVLTNIGIAEQDIGVSPTVTLTQKAGFWHTIKMTEETLVSFNKAIAVSIPESTPQNETTIGLALNKPAPSPITVTISIASNCQDGDYTLLKGTTAQTANILSIVFAQGSLTNEELKLIVINDRVIEEDDEFISLSIDKIEGESTVHKGLFDQYTINIPANDAWPLTGTVKYLGSQTGNLVAFAKEMTTGDIYDVSSEWDTNMTSHTFTTKVPPGEYTICAYIDSDGAGTLEQNEWEVKGSYTWTATFDEDGDSDTNGGGDIDNIVFVMNDPIDRYAAQFKEYTGTYVLWFESYPKLLSPDEKGIYRDDPDADWDQDGYTNFQEYLNGTDPTVVDEAYVFNGYDPASDADAASVATKYQIVSTNPIVPKARFDQSFLVDINYTTSDKNRGTTGLGLAIHYNSTFMTFSGFSNTLTETLAGGIESLTTYVKNESEIDTPDDGFEDTDKVILIAWVSDLEGRSWPGMEVPLPLRLCTLKFSVKSEAEGITYGDTSVLRFSATSKDSRYTFYAAPTTIQLDRFNFDVDGNGKANALTDGLLIMRYLFGLIIYDEAYPNALESAVATDAIRKKSNEIWTYLNNGREELDIDRNGDEDALTDALLIMRYMFNLDTGDSLIENAIGENAENDTAEKVIPFIKHYLPQKYSPVITPATE